MISLCEIIFKICFGGSYMNSSDRLFRKAAFGGFNKDDVIDYVENMKNEFFEYRSQVENTIKTLNEKIAKLEDEAKTANKKAAEAIEKSVSLKAAVLKAEQELAEKEAEEQKQEESDPLSEISLATVQLRRATDELCSNLSSFMDRIAESSFAVTIAQPLPEEGTKSVDFTEPVAKKEEPVKPEEDFTVPDKNDSDAILAFIDNILKTGSSDAAPEVQNVKSEKSVLDDLLPKSLFK